MNDIVRLHGGQRRAIAALCEGATLQAAATRAGVSPETLRRWRRGGAFRDALQALTDGAMSALAAALSDAAGDAVAVLRAGLLSDSDALRLQAAGKILSHLADLLPVADFDERLAALERRGNRR